MTIMLTSTPANVIFLTVPVKIRVAMHKGPPTKSLALRRPESTAFPRTDGLQQVSSIAILCLCRQSRDEVIPVLLHKRIPRFPSEIARIQLPV